MMRRRMISLSNPHLKVFRDNIRSLKECWALQQMKGIRNQIETLKLTDREGNRRLVEQLEDKLYNLKEALRRSIVLCCVCEDIGNDRIFNPKTNEWICPDCYALVRNLYRELKERVDHGGDPGDHDLGYYATFLD